MAAYYNEFDPYAAEWLRNLIRAGAIADGVVDERSITDVRPDDLAGFTQCHFFAGIGGWSRALRLAGWPDDRPVWTGSPPCQPFSAAGKRKGFDDERHLWPAFFDLIRERRPPVLFGEQVDAAVAHGWLDALQDDLEAEGYAVGATAVPACGVGAPHIRQRLWFVAERVADAESDGRGERWPEPERGFVGGCGTGGVADAGIAGLEGRLGVPERADELVAGEDGVVGGWTSPLHGFWRDADWLLCRDGKWRPVESGIAALAHGVRNRVGRLRAYGNAIVPQVAAEVIRAYMDTADLRSLLT